MLMSIDFLNNFCTFFASFPHVHFFSPRLAPLAPLAPRDSTLQAPYYLLVNTLQKSKSISWRLQKDIEYASKGA